MILINPYYVDPSTDPDAQAFITAASITDPTQQEAVNQLVVDLKGYSLWTEMYRIYPMVGGSATSCRVDLKALTTGTFYGGWTYSNGALPNGTTGYFDTGFNPSTGATYGDFSFGIWSRTNTIYGNSMYGCRDGVNSIQNNLALGNFICGSFSSSLSYTASPTRYLMSGSHRTPTVFYAYRDAVSLGGYTPGGVYPNFPFFLGAVNDGGAAGQYNVHELAFSFLGKGLSDSEMSNLYTAVSTFNTTLGR